MKAKQLQKLGFPSHLSKPAKWAAQEARANGASIEDVKLQLQQLVSGPDVLREDPIFGELAKAMSLHKRAAEESSQPWRERDAPAPFQEWGQDLEPKAVEQVANACRLPIAVKAALMPDAHLGYGLPIGGVLACDNAVIPYAVGVDIACRVKLSILDTGIEALQNKRELLKNALETETRFGMGACFGPPPGRGKPYEHKAARRQHAVLDQDWSVSPVTQQNKDRAWAQLGSSGSSNHFVEFGTLTINQAEADALGLDTSLASPLTDQQSEITDQTFEFLALLSHSGSRGPGAAVCEHYSRIAQSLHPKLPKQLQHLAWLDLDSHEGQEYWAAMNLMGDYASANHACIHDAIVKHIKADVLTSIENHHNFAWQEQHPHPRKDGTTAELIVHRKGATPAGEGELGIIPGSMAAPGFIVRGKGNTESLQSATHGAGRVMSRRQAKQTYRWAHVKDQLQEAGVEILSAGIDENPEVYKDIHQVMADQADLVDPVARFDPKLVKMAPEGERAED